MDENEFAAQKVGYNNNQQNRKQQPTNTKCWIIITDAIYRLTTYTHSDNHICIYLLRWSFGIVLWEVVTLGKCKT